MTLVKKKQIIPIHDINIRILLVFLTSWIIAFLFLVFIPANAIESNIPFLLLINITFIITVLCFAILTYTIIPKPEMFYIRNNIDFIHFKKNISFLSYAPIIGILMILYDRVVLRGIDYSHGLRTARYAWLETVGGSFFGVLGNLLVPFSYIGIFFLVKYYNQISLRQKTFLLLAIFSGIVGHAALNGGRSNLLLALVIFIIALLFKHKSTIAFYKLTKTKILLTSILLISFMYVNSITKESATMGDASMHTLVQLGTEALYGVPDSTFYNSTHSELIYFLIYSLSYLYHGQWTTQAAIAAPQREGSYASPPVLYQLGVIDPPAPGINLFSDTGAFISLPGAFYYDGGLMGLLSLSVVLGISLGIIFIMVSFSKTIGGFKMAFIVAILYILILSPILPAYGLSYFNFILFAFIAHSAINTIFFKKNINYL